MAKSDQLWQDLFQYGTHAPRGLVVAYVKAVVDEVRELPKQDLVTKDELVASKLITSIAQQEWINPDSEPELEDILKIAAQLDMHARNEGLWQELFEVVDKLCSISGQQGAA